MGRPVRRGTWLVAVLVTILAGASGTGPPVTAAPMATAVPACTPAAPVVVGTARDRLVTTVPACPPTAGATGYRLEARTLDGTVATSVDVPAGQAQGELTGLVPGSTYAVRARATNADGAGATSAPSLVAAPPFASSGAVADHLHADFTDRAPTAAERADWATRLGDGRLTVPAAVVEIAGRPYWQVHSPVIRLYQAYYLRRPDKGGLDYWVGRARAGMTINQMSAAFAAAPEFRTLYGTLTNRQFVERIYLNVLGRPGEPAGVDYWTAQLDSRTRTRGQVMVGFSESPEYRTTTAGQVRTVNLFNGMLRRMPTAAEVTTWSPATELAIATHLLGTTAYEARVRVVPPPWATTATLPNGARDVAYPTTTLAAAGGQGTLTWSRVAGALPAGLVLSTSGVISGTPTAGGTASFTVEVRDGRGQATRRSYSIAVSAVAVTTTALADAPRGIAYTAALEGAGSAPLTWAITAGALPAGLSLATSSGSISGTPTTLGTSSFTVRVTDGAGQTASRALTLAVTAPSDWPQRARDGGGTAWAPDERSLTPANVGGLHEQWTTTTCCASDPAVAGGVLYAFAPSDADPRVAALVARDLSDGTQIWSAPVADPHLCAARRVMVDASAVYVMCSGSIRAYARGGAHQLLWDTADTDPGTVVSEAILAGPAIVVWSSNTGVRAYRTSDGQRLWQAAPPGGAKSVWDVVVSGTTAVIAETDRLRAVSATNGAPLWSRTDVDASSLVVAGGWVYTDDDAVVKRYALGTGAPGWTALEGQGVFDVVAADADTVYAHLASFSEFGDASAEVVALRQSDGSERWRVAALPRLGEVAITGDLVWVTTTDIFRGGGRSSALRAHRRTDGAQLRSITFPDNMYASAAFANGRVVVTQGGSAGNPEPMRHRTFGLAPPLPVIANRALRLARVGTPYRADLAATNGQAPYRWSLVGGGLPAGLSLAPGGAITGTPSASGLTRATFQVVDARGRTARRTVPLQVVASAPNGDWPTTGRDGARSGANPGETAIDVAAAPGLAFRWRTAPVAGTARSGTSAPVVVGDRLVGVEADGTLRAWSTAGTTANRAAVWTTTPSATDTARVFLGSVTASGGTLYAVDDTGALVAVRASDGARLWRRTSAVPSPYPNSSPLVVGGVVALISQGHSVRAFDAATGNPAWGGAVVALPGGFGGSSLATDGTRIFANADCRAHAITVATGAVAWSVPSPGPCASLGQDSVPLVADGAVIVQDAGGTTAVEATTGAVRWRSTAGASGGSAVASHGLLVFARYGVGSGDTVLTALDLATGAVAWEQDADVGPGGAAAAGDLLVVRGAFGVAGHDIVTGEPVWDGGTADPRFFSSSTVAISGGRLFIGTAQDGFRAYGPLT